MLRVVVKGIATIVRVAERGDWPTLEKPEPKQSLVLYYFGTLELLDFDPLRFSWQGTPLMKYTTSFGRSLITKEPDVAANLQERGSKELHEELHFDWKDI